MYAKTLILSLTLTALLSSTSVAQRRGLSVPNALRFTPGWQHTYTKRDRAPTAKTTKLQEEQAKSRAAKQKAYGSKLTKKERRDLRTKRRLEQATLRLVSEEQESGVFAKRAGVLAAAALELFEVEIDEIARQTFLAMKRVDHGEAKLIASKAKYKIAALATESLDDQVLLIRVRKEAGELDDEGERYALLLLEEAERLLIGLAEEMFVRIADETAIASTNRIAASVVKHLRPEAEAIAKQAHADSAKAGGSEVEFFFNRAVSELVVLALQNLDVGMLASTKTKEGKNFKAEAKTVQGIAEQMIPGLAKQLMREIFFEMQGN